MITTRKLLLLSSCLAVAATSSVSDHPYYNIEGPAGLNVSVDINSGTISAYRNLDHHQLSVTTTSAPSWVTGNASSQESTSQPTLLIPQPKILKTGKVVLQMISLRQINNESNITQQTVSLENCVFRKVKENIGANQSSCTTFACQIGLSSLDEEVCLVPLDDPNKSVVKIQFRLSEWTWCQSGDQSGCGQSDLEMNFNLSIRFGDSILKPSMDKLPPSSNYTRFSLGCSGGFAQFWKSYIEEYRTLSRAGDTSLSLSQWVTALLGHQLQTPTSTLTYQLTLDPGYEECRGRVISESRNVVAQLWVLIYILIISFSLIL